MTRLLPLLCGLLLFACGTVGAQQDDAAIQGVWLSGDGDGWIELTVVGGELRGRIAGSPDDPEHLKPPRLDNENPDPALRGRPLLGLVILSGFRYTGDGEWRGGRIYDPNSGNTYKGTIRVLNRDTLALRGYVGISLFGRTETWRRRPEPE
jgi:uncharacterized protein (DUF2147 family)